MNIITKASIALQQLFGTIAIEAAKISEVIVRQRKFTALSLAKTFILGFMKNPLASDEQLAQMANLCGAKVTPQAIDQRHTRKLVRFLQELFCKATKLVVGTTQTMAPILERFAGVYILDSTIISLPPSAQEEFPGCGGSNDSGAAAMKVQTVLDLCSGSLAAARVEPGRSQDLATPLLKRQLPVGSLQITDLGYFALSVFAAIMLAGSYFLSRLKLSTSVLLPDGTVVSNLYSWLDKQAAPFIDTPILLGKKEQLPCRLIAWRVPQEQADKRRRKLHDKYSRKQGRAPSKKQLALCDWTILVTNVPAEKMTPKEAAIMYRARWQVELLFKRWKSLDKVALLHGSTEVRQLVRVWSRLLAALVRHWLIAVTAWSDPVRSITKAWKALSNYVEMLAKSLHRRKEIEEVIDTIRGVIGKSCKRNKRRKPGTFELLNDPSLLNYPLT